MQGKCAAVSKPGALCMLPGCSADHVAAKHGHSLQWACSSPQLPSSLRSPAPHHVRCCAVAWLAALRQQGQPVYGFFPLTSLLVTAAALMAVLQGLHRG